MKTISQSEFAKRINRTPAYIGKIKDYLTLVKVKGKKKPQIDLTGADTLEWLRNFEERNNAEIEFTDDPEPTKPETIRRSSGNNPSGLPSPNTDIQSTNSKSYYDIQLKKEQIEEKKIKNAQQRGDLIKKDLVELLFGRMYQIDIDQIKPLGVNLSPKIIQIINENNKEKSKNIAEYAEIKDEHKTKHIESILNSGEIETKTKIISVCEDTSATILANVQAEIDNFLNMLEVEE